MKDFNGSLKQVIMAMIEADTDSCEVTNTVGDISVTLDITILKIVKAGETVYDNTGWRWNDGIQEIDEKI